VFELLPVLWRDVDAGWPTAVITAISVSARALHAVKLIEDNEFQTRGLGRLSRSRCS
jgi:hypothetical protein